MTFTAKMLYNEQGEFFKALKQLNEQEDTRGPADVKKMTKERLRFFILIHFLSKKEENNVMPSNHCSKTSGSQQY